MSSGGGQRGADVRGGQRGAGSGWRQRDACVIGGSGRPDTAYDAGSRQRAAGGGGGSGDGLLV
jgi:hypothetical protein